MSRQRGGGIEAATLALREAVDALKFAAPVTHVYNPLDYAWAGQREYLRRFGAATGRVVMLGMNPGPFGMVQTGVPFGEVGMVRDWMGIEVPIGKPAVENPKRPVLGFACTRGEVSGQRLWGWARDRYGSADAFFERFFVLNYCPLVFMEAGGRNRTPDKLPADERAQLYAACDQGLLAAVDALQPSAMIGIGRFAYDCIRRVVGEARFPVLNAPHPSPASPVANRGWAPLMDAVVAQLP
ncbi:MAG: hypothetical protein PHP86_07400 [Nevskiales bacterium]|nr:hypothetical protein [Nevskiales bacterium]